MKNKYNVLAIRRELDNHIRNGAWNKFRSRLESLSTKSELLQAVVLTNKSKLGNGGTLLHAILKHNNNDSSAIFISKSVPQSLHVQDSRCATPLHLAIANNQSTALVESFLEIMRDLETKNEQQKLSTVLMTPDKAGDTPLLRAAREDATHLIPVLLRYDEGGSSATLIENKKKKRVALWYCVSNESHCAYKSKQYFPPREVLIVLLSTFFALQRSWGLNVAKEDWNLLDQLWKEESPSLQDSPWAGSYFPLVLRSLVACSHLLGKLSVKLMDLLSENESCPSLSREIDSEGNCLLHHLCLKDTRLLPDRTAANVTNSLLLVKRDDSEFSSAICHRNRAQNLPLHLAVVSHNFDYAKDLLEDYPEALQCTNQRGELPIHILLKLKPPFVDEISIYTTTLIEFWTNCPSTASIRDGETKLYPFQLAGCCKWGMLLLRSGSTDCDENKAPANATTGEEASDALWVNMIYDLLLAAPQVILD